MTVEELRAYVGAGTADDSFLQDCWDEAEAMVTAYVGQVVLPPEAGPAQERAVLEVAAELFHRRQAPGGITQFATVDGPAPVRMARDPMLGAYPILARWMPGGFA